MIYLFADKNYKFTLNPSKRLSLPKYFYHSPITQKAGNLITKFPALSTPKHSYIEPIPGRFRETMGAA